MTHCSKNPYMLLKLAVVMVDSSHNGRFKLWYVSVFLLNSAECWNSVWFLCYGFRSLRNCISHNNDRSSQNQKWTCIKVLPYSKKVIKSRLLFNDTWEFYWNLWYWFLKCCFLAWSLEYSFFDSISLFLRVLIWIAHISSNGVAVLD